MMYVHTFGAAGENKKKLLTLALRGHDPKSLCWEVMEHV